MGNTGRERWLIVVLLAMLILGAPASAITIDIRYDYDTGFFAGNAQATAALEAAASYFSNIFDDTFSAITVPAPYHSTAPGSTGVYSWEWQQTFTNPSTGGNVQLSNSTIPANQYIIYAGARPMSGITAGIGGAGGFGWQTDISGSNSWTPSDITYIEATNESFGDAVENRGETSGFARWGGSISFDTSGRTWHYNHTTAPTGGSTDFYSVAIHELAHALGFGQGDGDPLNVTPWEDFVSGAHFYGPNSTSTYGEAVPLYLTDLSHWAQNTTSVIYGTSTSQETAMDPDITGGTRKYFTALDAAAMKDIGWTVVAPPGVQGDYNNNGVVDAADFVVWRKNPAAFGGATGYTTWRRNFGKTPAGGAGSGFLVAGVPEPSGFLLAAIAFAASAAARRKRRG